MTNALFFSNNFVTSEVNHVKSKTRAGYLGAYKVEDLAIVEIG